jgi:hypothetical protein
MIERVARALADNHDAPLPFQARAAIEAMKRPVTDAMIIAGTRAVDNYPRVVALTGAAGSGKSTAADYLIRQHGYERVKFAGPLKAMLKAAGLTDNQIEGTDKEKPTRLLQGKTPRHAMQTLGHEWGRNCIGEGFWVFLFEHAALQIVDNGGRVVVDDLRFPNEAAAVRALGGVIVKLEGRGGIAGTHASEAGCGQADAIVDNDGCVTDLYAGVDEAIRRAA